jgi:arylsulfatase A-like enzyme
MDVSRRGFLKKASILISTATISPLVLSCRIKPSKQNVLFIAIDDLNDWIGCLGGHPQAITPNIDRLAKQGLLFTNAHCAVPLCGPSRAAIFTGKHPWNTGIFTNDNEALKKIGREFQTLPQSLRNGGYNTYGAGKLLHGKMDRYPKNLFTEFGPPYKKWLPFTTEETYYTDEEFNSPIDKSVLTHKMNRGPGKINVTFPLNKMPRERRLGIRQIDSFDWGPLAVEDSEMGDYETAEWAIQKLKKKQDKPFFLGVGIYRPHIPLFIPKKYYDMFPPNKLQLPKVLAHDLADLSPVGKDFALKAYTAGSHKNVVEHNQWREAVSCYLACIAFIDAQIGRVLDALEQSPYRDNTAIVLWSDHGWHLGEKEHWGKFAGWEESTRVPFIIVLAKNNRSGHAIGEKCNKPVSLIDLYPTLLDMVNLPSEDYLEGKSLVPLLKNPNAKISDHVITTFGRGNHSVRTEKWRYTRYYDGSEELYNSKQDHNEYNNLANKPEYDKTKQELKKKMPVYKDVEYFVSKGHWKAIIRKDRSKTELFNFKDNKAVPEEKNVAAEHPKIIKTMLQYIKKNNIQEKFVSIPD